MAEISAADEERDSASVLDTAEHRGEPFAAVRRGKTTARGQPLGSAAGRDVKTLLADTRLDPAWAEELAELRGLLEGASRSAGCAQAQA